MAVAVCSDPYKPPEKMGSPSYRAFYLPIQVPRRWRVGYLCFIPLLFFAVIQSSTRSFNSIHILESVQTGVKRQTQFSYNEIHIASEKKASEALPVAGDNVILDEWRVPHSMAEEHGLIKGSEFATQQEKHPWKRPLVFKAHMRRSEKLEVGVDLFLYTTGVSMGSFKRGFKVRGCVVGKDVYPVVKSELDVVMCRVARPIEQGVALSVAVEKDEALTKARMGPVQLNLGVSVQLEEGDITDLPLDFNVRFKNTTSSHLVAVRSVVTAEVSSEQATADDVTTLDRYEVCMVTQMKPYPHLLDDWVDYHRRIGVDMVYILDNGAPEDLSKKYGDRQDVEVLYWPWGRSQVQAMSWFLMGGRRSCEWILFTDADEYVMFGVGKEHQDADQRVLKRFVNDKRKAGYEQLFFRFILMGASSHLEIPNESVPEAYTHLHDPHTEAVNGKVLLRSDKDWFQMRIHWGKAFSNSNVTSYRAHTALRHPVEASDPPSLVHYQFRSWAEQRLKEEAGSPSISDRHGDGGRSMESEQPPNHFFQNDEDGQYTHFRDIWRAVSRAADTSHQTVVRSRGGRRCAAVRTLGDGGKFAEQRCQEDGPR